MKDELILKAHKREDVGKGASRRLRNTNLVPAIVYGANKAPATINLEQDFLGRALENEKFYTKILQLEIDGQKEQVVLKDVQRHPYLARVLHLDFQRVSATEKIIMQIPLHFKGGDLAPGVKVGGGVVSHLMSEVSIRCLPKDLPEFIDIDLSKMELNQTLHLSDLTLPQGTEVVGLVKGSPNDKPVVTVLIPKVVEEVAVEAPVAPVEVETVGEAKAKAKAAEEAAMSEVPKAEPQKGKPEKK